MNAQIISLRQWFETPPGRYLLDWERQRFETAVSDLFGFHALQLGLPQLDTLQANRMPHRWLSAPELPTPGTFDGGRWPTSLVSDFSALPFSEGSLDLVTLPHTLELSPDPHATLREVERVLVPEGRVVICCLNPASLWGLRQRRARMYQRLGFGQLFLPDAGDFIGYWRLRDWLRLLGFEVEASHFGCYRPAFRSDKRLARFGWMDTAGARWWPIFGSAYFLVAVKRVRGMKLMGPAWKNKHAMAVKPVSVTNRSHKQQAINLQTDRELELESN